ncbi:TlpA family protein disulfide reductase [Saccharicrinis sp. FJH62]|uniref:TlpA family protein disulfide reductase n=1 Tax=Saccharicrinis sp. FJH62 TaxID=3344657 RepID=UPI0035D45A9E
MKQIFFILALIALVTGCKPSDTAEIMGNISNAGDATVYIRSNVTGNIDTLQLSDGNFSDVVKIDNGEFLDLIIDRYGIWVYAKPGDKITVNFDLQDLKNRKFDLVSIQGSPESKLTLKVVDNTFKIPVQQLLAYPPSKFDDYLQNHLNKDFALIDSFKTAYNLPQDFTDMIKMYTNINVAQIYKYYPAYHTRYAPGDTSAVPESFALVGEDIPLDNMTFYKYLPSYKNFVLNEYQIKIDNALGKYKDDTESDEYLNESFDAIDSLDADPMVKNDLGKNILRMYPRMTPSQKTIAENRYLDVLSNDKDIDEFMKQIDMYSAIKPGKQAPEFSYPDINGNMVSLSQLKGKVVYLDIWATWCGPCKYEIPFLKKLQSDLKDKDIAFVNVSIDPDKTDWEDMIKKEDLQGYQLFADKAGESTIAQDYIVDGIPRFILIDKQGKIINADATRPSDPTTLETLSKYANMK